MQKQTIFELIDVTVELPKESAVFIVDSDGFKDIGYLHEGKLVTYDILCKVQYWLRERNDVIVLSEKELETERIKAKLELLEHIRINFTPNGLHEEVLRLKVNLENNLQQQTKT